MSDRTVPTPATYTAMALPASLPISKEVLACIEGSREEALRKKEAFQAGEFHNKALRWSFSPSLSCQHTGPISSDFVVIFKGRICLF